MFTFRSDFKDGLGTSVSPSLQGSKRNPTIPVTITARRTPQTTTLQKQPIQIVHFIFSLLQALTFMNNTVK